MGSFDMTCAVSGLPIGCGDAVRVLLLTQNPYNRGRTAGQHTHSLNDYWFPRTFPLKGTYDDYGNVKLTTGGVQLESWTKCLQLDLVEKGWGENSVHDVAVRKKGMTYDLICDAISSGRIHVRQARDLDLFAVPRLVDPKGIALLEEKLPQLRQRVDDLFPKQKLPKSVPTRRRIEKLLTDNKIGLHGGSHAGDEALVNKVDAVTVRVRLNGYGDTKFDLFEKMKAIIEPHFAVMLTAGTGSYAHGAELLVRPYPPKNRYSDEERIPIVPTKKGTGRDREREPVLALSKAIVREDVWQAIVADTIRTGYDGPYSITKYRKLADELAAAVPEKTPESRLDMLVTRVSRSDNDLGHIFKDLPFCVGLETHWQYITQRMKAKKVAGEELADFLHTAAEFGFMQTYLMFQRYQWRPSSSSGPQHGEWGPHASFLKALSRIADAELKKEKAERKRYG